MEGVILEEKKSIFTALEIDCEKAFKELSSEITGMNNSDYKIELQKTKILKGSETREESCIQVKNKVFPVNIAFEIPHVKKKSCSKFY